MNGKWANPLIKKEPLKGPDYFAMLPKDIWNIIIKFSSESRLSILLTSHAFYDICQTQSFPPWIDPDMELVKAGAIEERNAIDNSCEKGDLQFFNKWNKIANGRWNPVRSRLKDGKLHSPALDLACHHGHCHIVKELVKDKRLEPIISDVIIHELQWYCKEKSGIMPILLTFETLDKSKIIAEVYRLGAPEFKLFQMIYVRFFPELSQKEIQEVYDRSYPEINYIDYNSDSYGDYDNDD